MKVAIPIAVGDNLKGYRIVGTIPGLFSDVEYARGGDTRSRPAAGCSRRRRRRLSWAVLPREAQPEGRRTFHPFHGLAYDPSAQHAETYTVVGILDPTNTPLDKVILIPIKGVQTMSGHDPRAATDISAVLIKLRSPTAGFMLDIMINKQGNRLTFAYPIGAILADLFSKISWFDRVLALVAYIVALVAAASVLASIYNSMNARKRDIAILRSLGARRRLVFGAVVAESACIGALGAAAGFGVYIVLFAAVARIIRAQTGVVLSLAELHPVLALAPVGLIVLCALGGVVPAAKAYRLPVAENLAPLS